MILVRRERRASFCYIQSLLCVQYYFPIWDNNMISLSVLTKVCQSTLYQSTQYALHSFILGINFNNLRQL